MKKEMRRKENHPTCLVTTNRDLRTGQPGAQEPGREEKRKENIFWGREGGKCGGEGGRGFVVVRRNK